MHTTWSPVEGSEQNTAIENGAEGVYSSESFEQLFDVEMGSSDVADAQGQTEARRLASKNEAVAGSTSEAINGAPMHLVSTTAVPVAEIGTANQVSRLVHDLLTTIVDGLLGMEHDPHARREAVKAAVEEGIWEPILGDLRSTRLLAEEMVDIYVTEFAPHHHLAEFDHRVLVDDGLAWWHCEHGPFHDIVVWDRDGVTEQLDQTKMEWQEIVRYSAIARLTYGRPFVGTRIICLEDPSASVLVNGEATDVVALSGTMLSPYELFKEGLMS